MFKLGSYFLSPWLCAYHTLPHTPTQHTHTPTHSGHALLMFPLTHCNRFRCSSTPHLSGLTFHWKQISPSLSLTHTHPCTHTFLTTTSFSSHISHLSLRFPMYSHLWPSKSFFSHLSLPWVFSSSCSSSPPSFSLCSISLHSMPFCKFTLCWIMFWNKQLSTNTEMGWLWFYS